MIHDKIPDYYVTFSRFRATPIHSLFLLLLPIVFGVSTTMNMVCIQILRRRLSLPPYVAQAVELMQYPPLPPNIDRLQHAAGLLTGAKGNKRAGSFSLYLSPPAYSGLIINEQQHDPVPVVFLISKA